MSTRHKITIMYQNGHQWTVTRDTRQEAFHVLMDALPCKDVSGCLISECGESELLNVERFQ